MAAKDAQLDDGKRNELTQFYADRSLALLQQAVARGFKDVRRLKSNPDFQPLHGREDFKKLIADLEAKSKEA